MGKGRSSPRAGVAEELGVEELEVGSQIATQLQRSKNNNGGVDWENLARPRR
jgi:hypothetical protein